MAKTHSKIMIWPIHGSIEGAGVDLPDWVRPRRIYERYYSTHEELSHFIVMQKFNNTISILKFDNNIFLK
jgi:hypothetical protein